MMHRRDILKGALGAAAVPAAAALPALPGPGEANAFDPFAVGSAEEVAELVDSQIEYLGGDGVMWRMRKRSVFLGAMVVLVWKRNQGRIALDAAAVRDHLDDFDRYVALASERGLPELVRRRMQACVGAIPLSDRLEPDGSWSRTTLDQFEYHMMDFRKVLTAMIAVSPATTGV
jgi:hypothetical protein